MREVLVTLKPSKSKTGRRRPPPQTGRMTWDKLYALIKAGYGQGHGLAYKPWLRVTKRDYSPSSTVGHLPKPGGHSHHFRATGEEHLIVLLQWLGAYDVRDNYPAWPWSHEHPLCGLPGIPSRILRGLLEVASDAGIDHGVYAGTDIPYVATIDILTTWRSGPNEWNVIAHDCKPREIAYEPNPLSRPKERIELLRLYCAESGIQRNLAHPEAIPRELWVNLDALHPRIRPEELGRVRASPEYEIIVDACTRMGYCAPPYDIVSSIEETAALPKGSLMPFFRLAIWTQDIDHDLSLPLETWHPLIRGGRTLKEHLRQLWCDIAS